MKRNCRYLIFLCTTLMFLMKGDVCLAASEPSETEMQQAYNNVISYITRNNIDAGLSYSTFKEEYYNTNSSNIQEYTQMYYSLFEDNTKTGLVIKDVPFFGSLKSSKWYYNTGEKLPQKANYTKYNLLRIVEPGDIIYEREGGYGITGHIAIVEGIYYDTKYKQNYIRIIEAIKDGVCRSVLDDQRVDDKDVVILKVKGASKSNISGAIAFCKGQIGRKYFLDLEKNTSKNEKDWYCSELVWAAYYNEDIDIETTGKINEPGITPRDIKRSGKTEEKTFYEIGMPEIKTITSATSSSMDITWDKVKKVTGYKIYRSATEKGTYRCVGKTNKLYYTDKNLSTNRKYFYKITSYTSNGESNESCVKYGLTRLKAPAITSGTANSKSSVTIKWSNVTQAKQYYVYRAEKSNGDYKFIASTTKREYKDSNLKNRKTYYYKVLATTKDNITELSKYKAVTTK